MWNVKWEAGNLECGVGPSDFSLRSVTRYAKGWRAHHETRHPRHIEERLMCVLYQRWLLGTTGEGDKQQYDGQREDRRGTDCDQNVESSNCHSCPWPTGCRTWCSSPPHSVSPTGNWRCRYLSGWCGRRFIHYPGRLGGRKLLCPVDVDSMAHVETEG